MRVLFAAADRDLLLAYKKLLELEGMEVTTAFDGTQVITYTATGRFDAAVIGESLPRVELRQLVRLLRDEKIPSLVLSEKKETASMLSSPVIACSYLSLPFLPEELREIINGLYDKRQNGRIFTAGDVTVDVQNFCMDGETPLTSEEIDILYALSQDKEFDVRRENTYINSINIKLENLHKTSRIRYILNKGYRLVSDNE